MEIKRFTFTAVMPGVGFYVCHPDSPLAVAVITEDGNKIEVTDSGRRSGLIARKFHETPWKSREAALEALNIAYWDDQARFADDEPTRAAYMDAICQCGSGQQNTEQVSTC